MNAPLSELATTVIPSNIRGMLARDLWSTDRGWDFEQIMPYIWDTISLRLRVVVLDTITGAEDRISWDLSPDGKFNVQSAYRLLTLNKCPQQQMSTLYYDQYGEKPVLPLASSSTSYYDQYGET